MNTGNGSGSFASRKSLKLSADSPASHIPNPAFSQRTSYDESLADGTNLLELERKLRNYRNEEANFAENERNNSCEASLKQDSQYEPILSGDQIRRSRQSRDDAGWNDKLATGDQTVAYKGSELFPKLNMASERLSSHISNSTTMLQSNAKQPIARRDSEILKGNSFSALSIPDSPVCYQDPFSDCAIPVPLRVRTDLSRKCRQYQSRDKAHSLPSSPTGKKVRNVGRRGTVQSAVEPQTKRKIQAPLPPSTRIDHEGEISLNKMNRGAKISLASNDSPIATREDLCLPSFSIPTYLELELSSHKPPVYDRILSTGFVPFESSKVTLEKLLNFLIVPLKLELFIGFGTLACFDSWLYTFTILPLRFCKAVWILFLWLKKNAGKEIADLGISTFDALTRLWYQSPIVKGAWQYSNLEKGKASNTAKYHVSYADRKAEDHKKPEDIQPSALRQRQAGLNRSIFKHRRIRSTPSVLVADHKADLLKGLLFIFSCLFLTHLDASRMYHNIRGQATIKLYVIYNVLEVCDKLLSALGQDVMECLLSNETLERNSVGRSKVLQPLGIFVLALVYNVLHSTALFYQVITLNVAVNSYSNALLTLLLSNQFVEIKGTVFKRIEKENLFQLTCADVVERFQMWLMLIIIAMRNFIEVGATNNEGNTALATSTLTAPVSNFTGLAGKASSILPQSFTLLPSWAGTVLWPFFLVLGSEMLVDWLKHAYITKFNNTKPAIYERFLDVAAKDYSSHAFVDQNLTRRIGLPVLPLACLFMRAALQTYRMFTVTQMQILQHPFSSDETTLSAQSTAESTSEATMAAFAHIDQVIRQALGRSAFGISSGKSLLKLQIWSRDEITAFGITLTFFLIAYLVLLALKVLLGICMLTFARQRCQSMKQQKENETFTSGSKKVGGWGLVDVDEEKRKWIYADDPEGVQALREREAKAKEKDSRAVTSLDNISRFSMVSKRIW